MNPIDVRAQLESQYEKLGPALAAYACCFGLDYASAEDIVQQIFLRLVEQRRPWPDNLTAYLHRAVRNSALNYRRDLSREAELPENDLWLNSDTNDPESSLAVQASLRTLPEDQREVVFLKIWSGMTLQEIADLLGISINTAASRYRYSLDKLREQLQPTTKERG